MVQPSVAGWKQCFYGCGKTLNKTENDSKSQKKSSEASYGYILSGQKCIKNAKNGQFLENFQMGHFE